MRIFIEVITPGNGKKYEFECNDAILVSKAKAEIERSISLFENDAIKFNKEVLLLSNMRTKTTLDESWTMREAGVKSGDLLMLI